MEKKLSISSETFTWFPSNCPPLAHANLAVFQFGGLPVLSKKGMCAGKNNGHMPKLNWARCVWKNAHYFNDIARERISRFD